MNCEQIQNDLSAYVDSELLPTRKAEVEAHVNGCAACQQRVAELKKLSAGVAAMPKLQPAPQFLADVRRRLRAEPEKRDSWADMLFRPYWLKVPVEAFALILVAGIVLVLVRPHQKTRGRVAQANDSTESAQAVAAAPASPPLLAPASEAVDHLKAPQEARSFRSAESSRVEKDESVALPFDAKLATGAAAREEFGEMVVTAADATAVRTEAIGIAARVGGKVLDELNRSPSHVLLYKGSVPVRADGAVDGQRFRVEVPASQASQFRSELVQAVEQRKNISGDKLARAENKPLGQPASSEVVADQRSARDYRLGTDSNETRAVTLGGGLPEAKSKSQVEPMAVIEVVIVPPAQ